MYACGLRASEAVGLEISDVDLEEGLLCARGKGSKERLVPIGRQAVLALRAYWGSGRPQLLSGAGSQPHVFLNRRGGTLTRQGLYKIVQGHARRAGLEERMSPHTLRHSFATHLLAEAVTCAPCRRCSGTPTWPPPRSTPTCRPTGSRTPTSAPTPEPPVERGSARMSAGEGRRAIVLVMDACGVGALPDADLYGDAGTNTLAHLAEAVGGLDLPTLGALGLGSILPLRGLPPAQDPAIHGRLHPLGPGKDSVSGHWELMGAVLPWALPTYPQGFPEEVLGRLREAMGHELICNRPANGLAAIEQFGAEHLRSGALILYTSQDSVLQLAAHVDRVEEAELYRACAAARACMTGEHAVGRVIARPFAGAQGSFKRTNGRRDFALQPPGRSYLEELVEGGVEVHGVGKIEDLFAGLGVSRSHPGASNAQALASVEGLLGELEEGLVFANLIETDQLYGHRKDVHGFAGALAVIDEHLRGMIAALRVDDLLIVTADHGVDPAHRGTDHTREYAPLLALTGEMAGAHRSGGRMGGARHDGPLADVGASVLRRLTGAEAPGLPGEAFIS